MMQNWLVRGKVPIDWPERTHGENNPKNINSEDIHMFESAATEKRTWWSAECCQGQWYNRNYWRTWQVTSKSRRQNLVP